MGRLPARTWLTLCLCVALITATACDKSGGPGGGPPGGPGGPPDGKGGPPSPIRGLMMKLAKGPQSLTPSVGLALKAETIDWPALQTRTTEFAQLADELKECKPRKGTQESWDKLAGAYAVSAHALDAAAKAKNKEAAVDAHKKLSASCEECHEAHRGR